MCTSKTDPPQKRQRSGSPHSLTQRLKIVTLVVVLKVEDMIARGILRDGRGNGMSIHGLCQRKIHNLLSDVQRLRRRA